MYSLCGSTTAMAPIGLSQCSRPLSPLLPSVPAEPFTTVPPLPCWVLVTCAAAIAGTSATEAATSTARVKEVLTIGILQTAVSDCKCWKKLGHFYHETPELAAEVSRSAEAVI